MEKEISSDCDCQAPDQKKEITKDNDLQNVLPFDPISDKKSLESIEATNDLKSKKFIAYIVAIIIGLGGFLLVYLRSTDLTAFGKYLDFLLYSLVAYIGGNSMERITNKMGK